MQKCKLFLMRALACVRVCLYQCVCVVFPQNCHVTIYSLDGEGLDSSSKLTLP